MPRLAMHVLNRQFFKLRQRHFDLKRLWHYQLQDGNKNKARMDEIAQGVFIDLLLNSKIFLMTSNIFSFS